MKYQISFSPLALAHIDFWRNSGQKAVVKKIAKIIEELEVHPETGTGKPERLRGDMSGLWSRRLSQKDRMIYSIREDVVVVEIVSALGHYGDK